MLRSLGAMAREAEREQRRHDRAIQRERENLERDLRRFEKGVKSIQRKLETYESRFERSPISSLGVSYDEDLGWTANAFDESAHDLDCFFELDLQADPIQFQPNEILLDGFAIRLLSCCITQQATFLALEILSRESKSNFKLTTKATPEKSRISILGQGGRPLWGFDGSINGRIVPGTRRIGTVAIQPFPSPQGSFEIQFFPKQTKSNRDQPPIRVRAEGPDISVIIQEALESEFPPFQEFEIATMAQLQKFEEALYPSDDPIPTPLLDIDLPQDSLLDTHLPGPTTGLPSPAPTCCPICKSSLVQVKGSERKVFGCCLAALGLLLLPFLIGIPLLAGSALLLFDQPLQLACRTCEHRWTQKPI